MSNFKRVKTIFVTLLFISIILFYYHQSVNIFTSVNEEQIVSTSQNQISILTANVGNLSIGCRKYLNNLCYKEVEERIAKNLQILQPDIISLQEVLSPKQCKDIESRQNEVCFDEQTIPQIRRLLGKNYTINCDSQNQFECIGVRNEIGTIVNCKIGDLCNNARTVPPITGCDSGFTMSAVTIKLHNGIIFDLVNVHLQSTSSNCRVKMMEQAFFGDEYTMPIIEQELVLIMGDFNFDPWRDEDGSTIFWQEMFTQGWMGKDFRYHSGISESNPPNLTSFFILKRRTVDFVVSNFAFGTCEVLGESPNTTRLDGGKGMDHRAIYGILTLDQSSR